MATILIVDDDVHGRQYLNTLLRYQGHRVLDAPGVSHAMALCRESKPDLIITDVLMPEFDGYDFVRQLRCDRNLADISVIFYTASYDRGKNTLALAEACGVSRVLSKPAEPEIILEAVDAVLKAPASPGPHILPDEFDREHARLVGSKLFRNVMELEAANEQLQRLAERLRSAQEDERKRIARHMHDELGQALTMLKMNCTWITAHLPGAPDGVIRRLQSSIQLADETIRTVRRIATELRPAILDLGIAAAIEWLAEDFQARTDIKCVLDLGIEDDSIDAGISTELFRIFQEALTNILRHAEATEVHIALRREGVGLLLEIHDNGKGIGADRIGNSNTLGLLGMRERVALIGGVFSIEGNPRGGTTVRVSVPLRAPSGVE